MIVSDRICCVFVCFFFFSSRRRHTRWNCDWSSDVCSSDLANAGELRDKRRDAHAGIEQALKRVEHLAAAHAHARDLDYRSEERRVGKECRCRGSPYHQKKKTE